MPSGNRSHVTIALGVAYLVSAAVAIYLSLSSGNYFFHTEEARAAWTYEPAPVLLVCAAMLAETLLLRFVLLGKLLAAAWMRAGVTLLVFVPWVLLSSVFVVHAPVYLIWHIVWVWALLAVMLVVFSASAVKAASRRLRRAA